MGEKYDRANTAGYYPNVSSVSDKLKSVNTNDMINNKDTEIFVKSLYNNHYNTRKCDLIDYEIVKRIALSSGVAKNQLYNYLLLQGKRISYENFKTHLYSLEYRGIIGTVTIHFIKDNKDVVIYDLDHYSKEILPDIGISDNSSMLDYHYNKDILRFLRIKIMTNQIVLNLLCHDKNIQGFKINNSCSNTFEIKNKKKNMLEDIFLPLNVKTKEKTYYFIFAADTHLGRAEFQRKLNAIKEQTWLNRKKAVLVVVGENMAHMQFLTFAVKNLLGTDTKYEIMYTHDGVWSTNLPGRFYAMARSVGQTGLITVKLL